MDLPPQCNDLEHQSGLIGETNSETFHGSGENGAQNNGQDLHSKNNRPKFNHAAKDILQSIYGKSDVCHDFQNRKGCNRANCRFLHISKTDEDYVRTHGCVPPNKATPDDSIPVCKDFLNDKCNRKNRCKFRHIDEDKGAHDSRYRPAPYPIPPTSMPYDTAVPLPRAEVRRRYREEMMEDEILYLRAQVSRLKRQVADLTANNEALMEDNARLRVSVKRPRAVSPLEAPSAGNALLPTYSSIGSTLSAFSNSPRLLAADPYSDVMASRGGSSGQPDLYSGGPSRPAASSLSFSSAYPRY